MPESEVARLLESIRLSYESAYLALHGPAMVAKHEFITKRMENMQQAHEQLQTIVGKEEATKLVVQTLEKSSVDKKPEGEPL
jgi:enoyl reductase-like protein